MHAVSSSLIRNEVASLLKKNDDAVVIHSAFTKINCDIASLFTLSVKVIHTYYENRTRRGDAAPNGYIELV